MTGAEGLPPLLAAELARQFEVLRLLGRGGMGAVWLARERALDRLVAIKVLSGAEIEAPEVRERFRREARIAARLVHPHIVPLHTFGETADALYFVMGYVEGETLAARLDRTGRLGRSESLRILSEIADALALAHREGVVHRDVKPENILLEAKSGRALLADFGVARADSAGTSVTKTGLAVGTPSFMSPEQAVGDRAIDGRSDVYSLGVVGYRMLAGRLPFTAGSLQALLAQHAVAKPDDLALAVAPADRGIAEALMRALEKDPTARWARAEDLRDELTSAASRGTALPDELERVQMVGTKILLGDLAIAGIFYVASFWNARWFGIPQAWIIILTSLGILPLLSLAWAFPTARAFGWRETLRTMLHPPESWSHWWPRSWRRADDIWDRLPPSLKRLRNVIDGVVTWLVLDTAFIATVATTGGGAVGDAVVSLGRSVPLWMHPLLYLGPKILALSWIGAEFVRVRRKLGVKSRDVGELLGLPHLSSHPGWAKPKFARLLAPESGDAPSQRAPQSPDELAVAIARLSDRLRSGGLLPDDEAAQAARSVRSAIAGLEAEVQRLHSELDPAEGERLERRLAALERGPDDAQLRRLLESQREVWQQLEQRRQEKEARRNRLRDQLAALWMQLVELDTRVSRGAQADPELTGQVRALSSELARAGEALTEVEQVLAPPAGESRRPSS